MNKFEMQFLGIGKQALREDFLQHVHNLHNVKLENGSTYKDLFRLLRDRFEDRPDELAAANDWIKFNETAQPDKGVFDTVFVDEDDQWASIDMVPQKQ